MDKGFLLIEMMFVIVISATIALFFNYAFAESIRGLSESLRKLNDSSDKMSQLADKKNCQEFTEQNFNFFKCEKDGDEFYFFL
jgi:prepilin-type N-terminal cleavage/methylation domain-containing protein